MAQISPGTDKTCTIWRHCSNPLSVKLSLLMSHHAHCSQKMIKATPATSRKLKQLSLSSGPSLLNTAMAQLRTPTKVRPYRLTSSSSPSRRAPRPSFLPGHDRPRPLYPPHGQPSLSPTEKTKIRRHHIITQRRFLHR